MFQRDLNQTEFVDFLVPFGGSLSPQNRWIKLAQLIPWNENEEIYRKSFEETKTGAPAKSGRIAFGALIIKERLGITDEETVEQILENPYLQFFLGLHEFRQTALFAPSMMVYFRSRFRQKDFDLINARIITLAEADLVRAADESLSSPDDPKEKNKGTSSGDDENDELAPPTHGGKLLIDATCTPADITYPHRSQTPRGSPRED